MKTATLLPSLRSRVGDWNYYVTTLSFEEVAALIKAPDEIHERRKLAEWIQREAIESHAEAIAQYIVGNPQRFLGSLIVGVYGGSPNWTPLNVKVTEDEGISEDQLERIEGRLGLLRLSGAENLFAIDGQHRVAGIKLALEDEDVAEQIGEDSVSAIFVAHDPKSDAGKQRTRRLFTTVNKKARTISKAAKIALDEDDGFAIVTRRLIDSHWLFEDARKYVLYSSGGSIPATDATSITSVVGLFEIIKDLYGGDSSDFEQTRPDEDSLTEHFELCVMFFDELLKQIPEYKTVFVNSKGRPGDYRQPNNNHLLFRPIGQRAFARAVQLLMSRGDTVAAAIKKLRDVEKFIQKEEWHYIVWNPIDETMITNKILLAEAQLLRLAGRPLRTKTIAKKLDELLASIADES
jgi:DNA sulfur modification protein DndB